ncbi:MAG: outer membrane beta-barrel protein [Candidatus Omnitrophica bacterium]|nr:outer membrane beta-barrel protein [Candidatus Omnitrophota bacterium]
MNQKIKYPGIVCGVSLVMMVVASRAFAYTWQGMELTPRVSVEQSYDDNITFVKDSPLKDYLTNLSLGFDLKGETKMQKFSLGADVTREMFTRHSSFDNTAEAIKASYWQELSKFDQITLKESFSHAVEPRSFAEEFVRTSGLYSTYNNAFNTDYRHEIDPKLAWTVRYGNEFTDFSNKDISRSMLNTIGTGADVSLDAVTLLKFNYDYSYRNFTPGSSAQTHEISSTVRRFLNKRLYLDLQAGGDFISAYDNGNYAEPMYRVALTQDIDETTQTGISFEKRYATDAYTQDLFNRSVVAVNLVKDLTSRITGLLTAFYGNGKYVIAHINEEFTGADAGLNIDLTKKVRLKLHYTYSRENSSESTRDYDKNLYSLAIVIKF